MSVKIRLARAGSKKRPFYSIVAADTRSPRDGRFIEKLGTYNPLLPQDNAERIKINAERIKHWISVGALPTERITKLMSLVGLAEKPAIADRPKKSAPKAKALERIKTKEDALKAKLEAETAAKTEADAAKAAPAPVEEEPAAPAEEAREEASII